MHIVLVHGYFLKGTGSNLFVQNIGRELCKLGHQVSLFCQEKYAYRLDFVEKAFDFDAENSKYAVFHSKETPYRGKCCLYRPNLNGFLPVFVYDRYEGYTVKELISCTKDEIERYIEYNKKAMESVLEGQDVNLLWTNHTVMQPVYAARSFLSKSDAVHIVTTHGSCLNFAVRKSPLIEEYAKEAIENVDIIVFVSQYSRGEFLEFFQYQEDIKQKSAVIPAGVDLEKFRPLDVKEGKESCIAKLLQSLELEEAENLKNSYNDKSSWQTDGDVIEKLSEIDFKREKIVLYYGKFLWTKGVQLIIATAPLVMQNIPDVRFILAGYGSSRAYFEALIDALDRGKREKFIDLIAHPEKSDESIDSSSTYLFEGLLKKLAEPEFADNYFTAAKNKIGGRFVFTGFLLHNHLKSLIACSEITVAPSIFPEAFGMVAAEALAAGVIPMQTNHSGFAEVVRRYVDEFSDIFAKEKLRSLYLDENLVLNMANNMSVLLDYYGKISEEERRRIRQRARKVSEDNYSWEAIVKSYLQLPAERG